MQNDNPEYAAIRRQVEAELQQKRFQRQLVLFLLSGFIFLLFVVMVLLSVPAAVSTVVINRDSLLSVVYFLAAGWLIALLFQALSTFLINSPGWARRMRRRLAAQALEDMTDTLPPKSKRQPDRHLRLSDEDAVLDVIEEQTYPEERRAKR